MRRGDRVVKSGAFAFVCEVLALVCLCVMISF